MIQDLLNIYNGDKITLIPLRLSDSEKGFEPLKNVFSFNILEAVRYSHSTKFQPQNFLRMDLVKQDFVRNEPVVISVNGAFVTTPNSTANEQYKNVLERMREGRPMKIVNRFLHNTTVVIKNLETSMASSEHYLAFQATFIHTFGNKISQTRPKVRTNIFVQPEKKTTVKHAAKREETTPDEIEDKNRACDIIQKRDWGIVKKTGTGSYQITAKVLPTDTINQIAAAVNTTPALILKLNPYFSGVDYNTLLSESQLQIKSETLVVVGRSTGRGQYFGIREEDVSGNLIGLSEAPTGLEAIIAGGI